jgi:hypothetical protein
MVVQLIRFAAGIGCRPGLGLHRGHGDYTFTKNAFSDHRQLRRATPAAHACIPAGDYRSLLRHFVVSIDVAARNGLPDARLGRRLKEAFTQSIPKRGFVRPVFDTSSICHATYRIVAHKPYGQRLEQLRIARESPFLPIARRPAPKSLLMRPVAVLSVAEGVVPAEPSFAEIL